MYIGLASIEESTKFGEHSHSFTMDERGRGVTTKDDSGHTHDILLNEILPAEDGHRHDILEHTVEFEWNQH